MSMPPPPPPGGFGSPPGGPPPGGYGPPPPMTPPPMGASPYGGAPQPGNDTPKVLGIVSLVAGIVAIPSACCWFLGWIPALVAIITGIVGLVQLKDHPGSDAKPFLIIGLVLGALSLLLLILVFVLGVAAQIADPSTY